MNTQRKRVVVAVAVLAAFAVAAVPASAGEEATVKATAPACRVDRGPGPVPGGPSPGRVSPIRSCSVFAAVPAPHRRLRPGLRGGRRLGRAGGSCTTSREDEAYWNFFLGLGTLGGVMVAAAGGATLVGGIMSLAVVSPAESRYAGILGIADPGLREAACAQALMRLAKRGKRSRTVRAVLYGALGLAAAASSGSDGPDCGRLRRRAGAPQRARQEPGGEGLRVLPGRESERAGARAHPGYRAARQLSGRPVPGFLAPHPPEDEGHTIGYLRR